jgi:gliding motility-associated-like protein
MRQPILFLILLAVLCNLPPLIGQVPTPNLFCVSNQGDGRDTLRFEIPTVDCGNADSLLVFQSDNPNGPFARVANVQNLGVAALQIPNPGNDTTYYYVQLAADCPSSLSAPSDTLSNLLPPLVPIQFVSVENGETIIRWFDQSPQIPKIKNYIIYRVDVGTEPIDTIAAPNSRYIDANSAANLQSEFYYLQALDGCGLSGSLGNQPHNTIFLEDSIDPCGRKAILNWMPYEAWDSVAFYTVHVSENQGPAIRVDSLSPNIRTAEITALDGQIDYTYYVEAHHPDSNFRARSNAISRIPDIRQGIRDLDLWGADVQDNDIELLWTWNADAELTNADIRNLSGQIPEISLNGQLENLQENNSLSVTSDLTDEQPLSFFIQTTDTCQTLIRSDTVSTAHIRARALPSFENEINIVHPQLGTAVNITTCRLLRYRNDQVETSLPLPLNQNRFAEPFDPFDRPNDEICYQLECVGQARNLDGTDSDIRLRSNISCPRRDVRIQLPNALRPQGENPEFKPLILFENRIQNYQMQIFDRWGQLLFETSDPKEGWRGQSDGRALPAGVYAYRIYIEQQEGEPLTRKGTLTLIR